MNDSLDHDISPVEDSPIVPTNDVEQFFNLLNAWHQEKLALVAHMRQVPPGTTVVVPDTPTVYLDGEALQAFQHGVDLVLSQLGTLPFVVETIDEANAPVT